MRGVQRGDRQPHEFLVVLPSWPCIWTHKFLRSAPVPARPVEYLQGMAGILDHLDYRDFVRAHYEARKAKIPTFSYRVMGDRLGLDQSFVYRIIAKTHHIAVETVPRFVKYFGLKGREVEYFELLVRYGRARGEREQRLYFERILALRGFRRRTLEEKQYAYFSAWHHAALRSLLAYHRFDGNWKALGEKLSPPITAKLARESATLLQELGLVRLREDGVFELVDDHVSTGQEFRSLAVRQFQREMLRLAGDSLERHPPERRNVSTLTVAVDEACFRDLEEMFREFRRQVLQRVDEVAAPDRVLQANFQLFPLTVPGAPPVRAARARVPAGGKRGESGSDSPGPTTGSG